MRSLVIEIYCKIFFWKWQTGNIFDILDQELRDVNQDSDWDFVDLSDSSSDSEFVPSDSETSENSGDDETGV